LHIAKWNQWFIQIPNGVNPEENEDVEKTQVLYGVDEIIKFIVPLFAVIRKKLDICVDYNTPSIQIETEPIWQAYLETNERNKNKIFERLEKKISTIVKN
jgi:hypothetical protein